MTGGNTVPRYAYHRFGAIDYDSESLKGWCNFFAISLSDRGRAKQNSRSSKAASEKNRLRAMATPGLVVIRALPLYRHAFVRSLVPF